MAIFQILNTFDRSYPKVWENPVLKGRTKKKEESVTTDVYLSNLSHAQGHMLANL